MRFAQEKDLTALRRKRVFRQRAIYERWISASSAILRLRRRVCGFALILILGCSDLERTNPLDPKNPDSQMPRRVLIEAFVNDIGGDAIDAAVAGLIRLTRSYPLDRFILLEHHIQKSAAIDSLALAASWTRYQNLVPQPANQAIPDVFFDGAVGRVQGASSAEAAYTRYAITMDSTLQRPAKLLLEAHAVLEGTRLHVTAKVARLGAEDAEEVSLYVALTSQVYPSRPVVRAWLPVEALGRVHAGEIRSIDRVVVLEKAVAWIEPACVVIAYNSKTLQVYHCVQAKLEIT